jgi:CO/xanthine dehydrogenase Mo-binding subunit
MRYLRTFGSVAFIVVGLAVIAAARNAHTKNETTVRRRLTSFLYNNEEDTFPVIEYKAAEVDPKHPDFVLIEHKGPHVVEFYSPMYVHHV